MSIPFALYNAFSETGFGGSPAGIIPQAINIDKESRQKIAREIGAPATSFVSHYSSEQVSVQFFSTVTELPMCGHGTVCLMTRLVDLGIIEITDSETLEVRLELPTTIATVEISKREDSRTQVMLDVAIPQFRTDTLDPVQLSSILGISNDDFHQELVPETAVGDFVHLVVPLKGLNAMSRLRPDFDAIVRFCHQHDIQTIAVFCSEVEQAANTLHVRDFCPAVGVAESAAAGTTNAALSCYLIRHQLAIPANNQPLTILAEQGIEINRPSSIRTVATMHGSKMLRLQVGGVATRVFDGQLYLPTQCR
ncbi:MAG: PhzF family phenazine biosynthesis protein [Gammaproteobacteria bacterium]|nr:PhzF family phenazine biosynthesis protein [Gammaproteobacteria bacterium]